MELFYKKITTIIGKLRLVSTHDAMVAIVWEYETPHRVKLDAMIEDEQQPLLLQTEKKLMEYFAGERTSFNIPLK